MGSEMCIRDSLEGYPGKYVVLARRKGSQWFVACLSGEEAPRTLKVDLGFLDAGRYEATIITDGSAPRTFKTTNRTMTASDRLDISIGRYGGCVAHVRPLR